LYRTKDQIAQEFIDEGKRRGITRKGIIICIATGLVESQLVVYANGKVPESLNLPHDAVGSDGLSVGVLQQQVRKGSNNQWWWADCQTCMDPTLSAGLFYDRLVKLDYNSDARTPGWYAQSVQKSAFPDRYDQRFAEATAIYDRLVDGKETIMGDPVWLADALRAEGVATVEYGDWKNIGHGDFGTIWGVVAHHTGGNSSANAIQNHPDLGLCSQIFLNRAGVAHVVGAGIAWHAGAGQWPGIARDNANAVTIGIEAENNGTEGWSPAQYWAYVKCCAAICRHLGVRSDRVIGHKEWAGAAQGKWDPGGIDMNAFRRDVQGQLDGGAKPAQIVVVNQIDEMQKVAGFWLGERITKGELVCGVDGKGRFAQFARGYIYWHPDIGARAVPERVFQYWAGQKWENGPLGYPVKNHAYIDGVGDIQAFERGVVFRKLTGSDGQDDPGHHVTGVIGDSFYKRGAETVLGWPVSNQYDFDGGRKQDFENGSLIWHPTGAVRVGK
jgi:hypothetical protein